MGKLVPVMRLRKANTYPRHKPSGAETKRFARLSWPPPRLFHHQVNQVLSRRLNGLLQHNWPIADWQLLGDSMRKADQRRSDSGRLPPQVSAILLIAFAHALRLARTESDAFKLIAT